MAKIIKNLPSIDYNTALGVFEPTSHNKLKCTLTGHEVPNRKEEIQKYIETNRFKNEYHVHTVLAEKKYLQALDDDKIYCTLTGRLLNKDANQLLKHLEGRRYKIAQKKLDAGIDVVAEVLKRGNEEDEEGEDDEEIEEEDDIEEDDTEDEEVDDVSRLQIDSESKEDDYDFEMLANGDNNQNKRKNPGRGCADKMKKKRNA